MLQGVTQCNIMQHMFVLVMLQGVTFSVTYKSTDVLPYMDCDTLVSPCKVNSHRLQVEGELQVRQAGVYTLIFDNTLSRFDFV